MGLINHKLYIETINAYIDPIMPVENAIITHGHADHARAGHQNVLATQNTIDIMKIRYGNKCANSFQSLEYHKPLKINDLTITFYPAGHILGSTHQIYLRYILLVNLYLSILNGLVDYLYDWSLLDKLNLFYRM